MAETVLVTGATGNTGGPLVEPLVQRGVRVRVLLRREADGAKFQGATVALADFDDERAVAAAWRASTAPISSPRRRSGRRRNSCGSPSSRQRPGCGTW